VNPGPVDEDNPLHTGMNALALLACLVGAGCAGPRTPPSEAAPVPRDVPPPSAAAVRAAIDRGVGFLAKDQNSDGSWGTARYKQHNVLMPVPGGHQAVRTAVTALCVSALIDAGSDAPAAVAALERGEDWLIANVSKVRLSSANVMYNNWAHAYAVQALVRMLPRAPAGSERRRTVRSLVRGQIDKLVQHQHLDGGWGYYAYGTVTRRPLAGSNSFMTATVLVGLHEAREAGFTIPRNVVAKAMDSIRRQRHPDFSYAYGHSTVPNPTAGINLAPGSLARSQACNAAMLLWNDERTTPAVARAWLNRLCARHGWLSMARKTIRPHEGHYAIAGYFYYYGFYYAGYCLGGAPEADQRRLAGHVARLLLERQEKDGSWWDFPLFNYHRQYGTGFTLPTLVRCLPHLDPPAKVN